MSWPLHRPVNFTKITWTKILTGDVKVKLNCRNGDLIPDFELSVRDGVRNFNDDEPNEIV